MVRILLVNMCVLFLLNGCSVVVGGVLDDKDGGIEPDMQMPEPDAAVMLVDCRGMNNGVACGDNLICLLDECVSTRCGDGFVDTNNGEVCDQASDVPINGCLPSCEFECEDAVDCDDENPCTTETCDAHMCGTGDPPGDADGNHCDTDTMEVGMCSAGLCAPPGCGDGMLDDGEACDDQNDNNEDGCRSNCTVTCSEDVDCSNADPCDGEETCNVADHTCVAATTALDCDDGEPCTEDHCDVEGCHNTFIDLDGDGFAPHACTTTDLNGMDCDDNDETSNPAATELCDLVDHDCDGNSTGEEVDVTCLRDRDMDGYGNPSDSMVGCMCPPGYIPPRSDGDVDCEDGLTSVNPGESGYHENPFGVGSYDYNCDGVETRLYDTRKTECTRVFSGRFFTCAGDGWVGPVPRCGETGTYQRCLFGTTGCIALRPATRTQQCH